jgi:hypothetical protein
MVTTPHFHQHVCLSSGMLLSADIVLEQRNLMAWLFEPILSLKGRLQSLIISRRDSMQELTFEQVVGVSGGDWADVASSALTVGAAGAALVGANAGLAALGAVAAFGNPVSLGIIAAGLVIGGVYELAQQ